MKKSKLDRGFIVRFYEGHACIGTQNVPRMKAAREIAWAFGGLKAIVLRGEFVQLPMYATYSRIAERAQ